MELTQAHDNAITESPRMSHQSLGLHQDVFEHLHCLRILKRYMFPLTSPFMKFLMYQLPEKFPLFPIVHHHKTVALFDEIMGDIGRRAVAINSRFLVNERFYNASITDYNGSCRTKFERNYGPIFFCPFCESESVLLASINIPRP